MSYLKHMGILLANTKSYEDFEAMENLFYVIDEMIDEKIKKYIADHRNDITVDIKTLLNGKIVDMPSIQKEINKQIIQELNNMV